MSQSQDHGIVVGVSDYPSPALAPLKGPVTDATLFAQWLVKPTGGGLDADNVRLITSPSHPQSAIPSARPTRQSVVEQFELIFDEFQAQGETGRRLYVFLSGHGCAPGGADSWGDAALLMANATRGRWRHHFPGRKSVAYVASHAMFHEVVLFMDCCRDLMDAVLMPPPWGAAASTQGAGTRIVRGYAAEWTSEAREDIDPDDGRVKGLFTKALLEVLNSGRIDGMLLKASVEAVMKIDPHNPGGQLPKISGDLDSLVFSEAANLPTSPVLIEHKDVAPGTQVELLDSNFNLVTTWSAGSQAKRLDLEPGRYGVRPDGGSPTVIEVLATVATRASI